MLRKLLAFSCGPLLLAACARAVVTQPAEPPAAPLPSHVVEAMRDYRPHDVPAQFQHLVDWHAGTSPVVLLFAAGGLRVCSVSPNEATRVIIGQPYRCRWSAPR